MCVVQMRTCECVCCVVQGAESRAIVGKSSTLSPRLTFLSFGELCFLRSTSKLVLHMYAEKERLKIYDVLFKSNGCQISSYKIIKYTQDMF